MSLAAYVGSLDIALVIESFVSEVKILLPKLENALVYERGRHFKIEMGPLGHCSLSLKLIQNNSQLKMYTLLHI